MLCSGILWIVGQKHVFDEHLYPLGDGTQQPFHQEQHGCWETNKKGPALIAASKVPNPAWRQLCTLAKNLSATCAAPVDLGDSYYDHACLDPGSVDADMLSPDKSDYTGKKRRLACCRCPAFEERCFYLLSREKKTCWFISSIYCSRQFKKHKKDYRNRPHTDAYTHPYLHATLAGSQYW